MAKINEANEQIRELQKDIDSLIPVLRTAEQDVKDCLKIVEGLQASYSEGRQKCKQQELEVEKMSDPIIELERLAKIELDKASFLEMTKVISDMYISADMITVLKTYFCFWGSFNFEISWIGVILFFYII